MLYLFVFALLMSASCTPVSSQDATPTVDKLIGEAQRALAKNEFVEAADLLLAALEESPEHENANTLLGSCYLALERSDLAEGFLFTALKVSDFTNVGAANNLAQALLINGDSELAVRLLEHTMQRTNRSDLSGLLEHKLGGVLQEKKDFVQAEEWYLAAVLLQPKNVMYWLSASTLSFDDAAVNLTLAENVLVRGLTENPLNPDLLFQLGLVMQRTNRLNEASTLYQEALRVNPSFPNAAENLATALHALGSVTEALSMYRVAVQQSPSNVVLLQNYASLLHAMEMPEQAADVIGQVAVFLPDDETVSVLLSDYKKQAQVATSRRLQVQANIIELALQARWNRVVEALKAAGTPNEDAGWWFFAAGMAQFFRGNYEDSLACCEKAQALLPGESHLAHGCMGIAHQYLKGFDNAVAHFTTAYSLLTSSSYEDPLPFLGFAMDQADLEVNLISALNSRGDYEQCISMSLELLGLPSRSQGGVTVLLFSFIDWTASMRKYVNTFGFQLVRAKQLVLPRKKTLFDEALRVQHSKKKFLNAAYDCVISSRDPLVVEAHANASAAISEGVLTAPQIPIKTEEVTSDAARDGFVLITQFYLPTDLALRQDIQEVLVRNLENDAIDEIYLICEEEYAFDQLPNYHKITKFLLSSRLKFSEALQLANDRLHGRTVILSNSDIFFDDSLQEFVARKPLPLETDLLLALSTWSPRGSSLSLSLRSDSQDAWMFTAPVPEEIIMQAGFHFGMPRCDNRIAKIFMNSGYRVKNPAFLVHAVEVDNQRRASKVYSKVGEVPGEVSDVPVSDSKWL